MISSLTLFILGFVWGGKEALAAKKIQGRNFDPLSLSLSVQGQGQKKVKISTVTPL